MKNYRRYVELQQPVERKYGLYHVNAKTGEVVPFFYPDAHGLGKGEAEQRAGELKLGQGRGQAYHDDWTVEARPE